MYFKKLKFIIPFILIFFIVSSLVCTFILPSPKIVKKNSIVYYDDDNSLIYEELNNTAGKYVNLEQISDTAKKVFITIEDKNFYSHLGIDGSRIIKAFFDNLKANEISQGASTITQQLSKNLYLNNDKNLTRKIKEIYLSFLIEKEYTKDEILESYFNTLYFGHGIYGIENASQFFFGINAYELDIPKSAMLVGIINAPSIYSPILNYEKSIEKFRAILNLLYINKVITLPEYELYYNYNFSFNFSKKEVLSNSTLFYIDGVKKELKKLNIKNQNGLIINTYFDSFSNKIIDYLLSSISLKESTNISIVVMKPYSNKIIASLGGKDYYTSSFNCATDSNRQIGSTIKPFLYYLGLKKGMTLLTNLNSSPTKFFIQNYGYYEPKNYNSLYANQDINMLEAIAYSDNIYAVKTGLLVGSSSIKNLFKSFGVDYLETPSSFLGSISMSLLKLVEMYNCLASEGNHYSCSFIKSIYSSDGTLLYSNPSSFKRLLNKNETIVLNQALTAPFDKNLKGYTSPSLINYQTKCTFAAKTGTTYQDNYVIGYNPSYTIGIWLGDEHNNELKEPGTAKKIFQKLANNICLESSWYTKNDNIKAKKIDPNTGLDSSSGSNYYFLKKWDI